MSKSVSSISPAPWKKAFEEHLAKSSAQPIAFALATASAQGIPSVRTCLHRGFWASVASGSPDDKIHVSGAAKWESDCPVFTTKVGSNKLDDIFEEKGSVEASQGSGGGRIVEAVYWFPESDTQWRVKGKCWIVAYSDIEGSDDAAQHARSNIVRDDLARWMRVPESQTVDWARWDWKKEIEAIYKSMDTTQQALFARAKGSEATPDEEAGQDTDSSPGCCRCHLCNSPRARHNFRVAIITPQRVERYDQSNPAKVKTSVFELTKNKNARQRHGEDDDMEVWEWVTS